MTISRTSRRTAEAAAPARKTVRAAGPLSPARAAAASLWPRAGGVAPGALRYGVSAPGVYEQPLGSTSGEVVLSGGNHVACDLPPGLRAIADAMSEDRDLLVKITSGTRREPGICAQLGLPWHHHRDSRGSTSGWPDLVIGNDQAGVFWELKTMKGRVSPAQREWLARLAAWGCTVGVRRPCCLLSGRIARELAALAGMGVRL